MQQQANASTTATSASTNDGVPDTSNDGDVDAHYQGMDDISEVRIASTNRDRSVRTTERIIGHDNIDATEAAPNTLVSLVKDAQSSSQHQRSVSIGSLEDLSHMIPTASAIALRLYNVFSNGNMPRHRPQIESKDGSTSENSKINKPSQACLITNESIRSPRTRRRSKRSHNTLHPSEGDVEGKEATSAPKSFSLEQDADDCSEDELNPFENEEEHLESKIFPGEAIAHAMHHPPSPSSVILNSATTINSEHNPEGAKSFFSFGDANQDSISLSPVEDGNVPTGCVGAYAHAIKTAASEVTRLVKMDHRANFERLSLEEQTELGVRFIDACTSDDKLPIVKDILQKQKKMDVDRFFIGPDDTETCALHAGELFLQILYFLSTYLLLILASGFFTAAFNGAEQVLKFLCGGIDERNPNEDCGLADVNVKDANGWTALHFAAGANSVTSVRVLAEHGAKLTLEASNGYTPFHWAERLSNEEVAAELEKLGADNRFVGRWMFGGLGGGTSNGDDRRIPFVSFLANQFFAFGR